MSNKQNNRYLSRTYRGFDGIDRAACHSDTSGARDCVNFRIREDGSLEKRCGYRFLTDVGGAIRAFYSTLESQIPIGYLLVGNTAYRMNLLSGEKNALGTVSTESGNACFFFYKGMLYLTDGATIYEYRNGTLTETVGYVPLIGKDWPCDILGEPNEPRNLLNRHARISYRIGSPASIFLCTRYPVESVEAVYVNDVLISPERYYIDDLFTTVNVKEPETGDRVTLHLTFREAPYAASLANLCTVTDSVLFGGIEQNRMFLYGGGAGSTVYCSSLVSSEQLAESVKHYSTSGPLYFPEGYAFTVGDGQSSARGMLRHFDRLLIFTEKDTWMSASDASGMEELPTLHINPDVGCPVFRGFTLAGNDPVTVGLDTVWRWTNDTDELNRCNAYSISRPIDSLLAKTDYANLGLYYHRATDELWMYNRVSGRVWIYHVGKQRWYSYSGILADRLFDANGTVGFFRGSKFFLFDPSLTRDLESAEESREIQATYLSGMTDFGSDKKKNLASLTLRADTDTGGTLSVTLNGNGTAPVSCSFVSDADAEEHTILSRRLSSGRFQYATVRLTATGDARPIIHSLTLNTR